jgi:phosphoglycolate phosphatase
MLSKTIIWDWNGTLLNDLSLCISSINSLLEKRKLPLLNTDAYKEIFSFPVKDYYAAIGFNFQHEDFSVPAQEFIDLYNSAVEGCSLQHAANEVISFFRKNGCRQFILSAMQQTMLEKTLKHNRIFDAFEGVAGLGDHYAVSKIERGHQLIREFNIEKEKTWMIGDTDHDAQVAVALGIGCILVADGHQSASRLHQTGFRVISNLKELLNPVIF